MNTYARIYLYQSLTFSIVSTPWSQCVQMATLASIVSTCVGVGAGKCVTKHQGFVCLGVCLGGMETTAYTVFIFFLKFSFSLLMSLLLFEFHN